MTGKGISPIVDRFLLRHHYMVLEFKEGFLFARVIRRRIMHYKPYSLIDSAGAVVDIAATSAQAELRLRDPRNSVASWSPVIVRNSDGLNILTLEELWEQVATQVYAKNDFERKIVNGYQIIDPYKGGGIHGFTPIKYIVRHWYAGEMLKIASHTGVVDITPNHSIYASRKPNGKPVLMDAKQLMVGDYLSMPKIDHLMTRPSGLKSFFAGTEDLAWLYGFFTADGWINRNQRNHLTRFSNQNQRMLEKAQAIFELNFHNETRFYGPNNEGMFEFATCGKHIFNHFSQFYTFQGKKRIPPFILNAPTNIQEAFLRGYMAGDGERSKWPSLFGEFRQFTTNSQTLTQGLLWIIKNLNPEKTWWFNLVKKIRKQRIDYYNRIGINKGSFRRVHPREVTKIIRFTYTGYVYDLETKSHSFMTGIGPIKAHNTDVDILFMKESTNGGFPWILHGAIGWKPHRIFVYPRFPEGSDIPAKFPEIDPIQPSAGNFTGYYSGRESPYEKPTDFMEYVIPPGQHVGHEFYNYDDVAHNPVANILFALYHFRLLKPGTVHNRKIRDIALGAPATPLTVGYTSDPLTLGDTLKKDWDAVPITLEEAEALEVS